jgi:hypothetical protein
MKEENEFLSQCSISFNEDLARRIKQEVSIKELIDIQRKMKRGWEKTLLEKMESEETERMISFISHKLTQEEDPNFSQWKIDHDNLLEYYATKDSKNVQNSVMNSVQKYYCCSETLEYKLYEYIAFYFRDLLKTFDFPEKLFNISLWIERQYVTIELDHEQIETYFSEILEN